ncbi:helix-turn-helix domain-containing protein [Actinoplanes sp. OR16]|uniref:ATP-binding protein n=1 Tax=Actinoplanes sp. OR16 TaxID=946334 RepID=UPI001E497580|nr:tetratricopeptide repeat protein [Actinoplanes sp. OR16]
MPGPQERLVEQLARIKELSGLSLRALARDSGLSSSSLSRYLNGQLVPPWDAVVALCRLVGRDPRPLRAVWSEASKAGPAPAPRRNDLPADLFDFTGRQRESTSVADLLRTVGAVALDGMAGVGKTSLAVHVAHRLAPAYPDGGLYLDLQGFTPGQEPVDPQAALARLLSALDVTHLPATLTERAALWRSELSRRRALVVLDNAADADQVRPLLPGAGRSAVLITSRSRLVSLDGVPPISIEPLAGDDAAALFSRAAGLDGGPEDVSQVLDQCGGLPLALRMAGARLRHRPGWTVAVLAERLRDSTNRFDAVFGMSLRQLDSVQRRTFRLLGVMPGTDFDTAVAGALTGMPAGRVDEALEELVDAHLLREIAPARYRMHDLIRQYAADLAAEEEPQAGDAVRRVLAHYLDRAREGDPAWFDLEYPNLVACVDAAVRIGMDEVTAELPRAMRVYFFRRRGTDEQSRLLEAASVAAGRLGRDELRAELLSDLGWARAAAGRINEAIDAYEKSQEININPALHLRLGLAYRDLGNFEVAREHFRRARSGPAASQALAFEGWVTLRLGQRDEAIELARESLNLAEGPARITGLVTLGLAEQDAEPIGRALTIAEENDLEHQQAWCHNQLGVILRTTDPERALQHHERALALLENLAEVQIEIDCLHEYAATCRATGRTAEAAAANSRIIDLARRLGHPRDEQRARESAA